MASKCIAKILQKCIMASYLSLKAYFDLGENLIDSKFYFIYTIITAILLPKTFNYFIFRDKYLTIMQDIKIF